MNPNGSKLHSSLAQRLARFTRTTRRKNGLNQTELADLAQVGRRMVSELENGKPTLQLAQVERVLAVLGRKLAIAKLNASDES